MPCGRLYIKDGAARIRNDPWKEDLNLREKLKDYVTEGLRREEILHFMLRDFDCYAWSIRTLDRRLRYFDIIYTDTDVYKRWRTGPYKELRTTPHFTS